VVFEGRRSTSSISVRDGDGGDVHAPLDQNVKVVLVTSPEELANHGHIRHCGNFAAMIAEA
jgi:hypothetical protein